MKLMYVYVLECADESFYVGVTNNVGRRFIEHITGIHDTSYTFSRRPLKLVYCREFFSPIEAIKYEKQLKRWTHSKKAALVNGDLVTLRDLSSCKNDTSHKNYTKSWQKESL